MPIRCGVAVDHGGGLPSPRLEDRRQLDAGDDHVLGRADPCAVAGEPLDNRRRQIRTRAARHSLEDARHLARVSSSILSAMRWAASRNCTMVHSAV